MAILCKICTNAEVGWKLTRELCDGASVRPLARQYCVDDSSLQRHKQFCLKISGTKKTAGAPPLDDNGAVAPRFSAPTDPMSLLDRAGALLEDANAIIERAKKTDDPRLTLNAIRETKSVLELAMKARGMLQPDSAVNVDARTLNVNLPELPEEEMRAIVEAARAIKRGEIAPHRASIPLGDA